MTWFLPAQPFEITVSGLLDDGKILESQACLVANQIALKKQPEVLETAKKLIEFIVAHLRAKENVAIFANIRGETPEEIADQMLTKPTIGGLQGPTISPLIARDGGEMVCSQRHRAEGPASPGNF